MTDIFQILMEVFQREKLFLRHKLKAEDICERMCTDQPTLRIILKRHGFRNFAHFVNYFRVMEAQKMMECNTYRIYTIEAISAMAGFANRQNFYNAFEKIVGVKPAVYRAAKSRSQI